MAFLVLALSQIFHSFNMRSNQSLFKIGPFSNKYLNMAAVTSLGLTALVVFVPPVTAAFQLTQLSGQMYLVAIGLSLVPVLILELSKMLGLVKHK